MDEPKMSTDDTSFAIDLSDATQAVKESRFQDAYNLLTLVLKEHPENIDSLYLASVSTRYLKKFEESKKYIEQLLVQAPDMGRAYQELAHLYRAMGNEERAVNYYRQAGALTPALLASWNFEKA